MKEVKKCSISGVAFTMDADAYQELENYLDSLKKTYKDTPDGAEIVADIEARIAELILTTQDNTRVVEKPLILNIIHQMGSVEDISEESSDKKATEEPRIPRRLYRDTENAKLGGVCAGIGKYFDVDPVWIRLGMFLPILLSFLHWIPFMDWTGPMMGNLIGGNNNHNVPAQPQSWAEYSATSGKNRWSGAPGRMWKKAPGGPVDTGEQPYNDINKVALRCFKGYFDFGAPAAEYTVKNGGCSSCPIRCYTEYDVDPLADYDLPTHNSNTCMPVLYGTRVYPDGVHDFKYEGDGTMVINLAWSHAVDDMGLWDNYGNLNRDLLWILRMPREEATKYISEAEYDSLPWEWEKAGDPRWEVELIRRMAYGEGDLSVIAKGTLAMMEKFGLPKSWLDRDDGATNSNLIYNGFPNHHGPAEAWQVGMLYNLVYNRDCMIHEIVCETGSGAPYDVTKKVMEDFFGEGCYDKAKAYTPINENKAKLAAYCVNDKNFHDSATLCNWMWPMTQSPSKEREYHGDLDLQADFMTAVTGETYTQADLQEDGARITQMLRAMTAISFQQNCGSANLRQEHDAICDWVFDKDPDFKAFEEGTTKLDRADMEKAKDLFYDVFGWDRTTGVPTRETLEKYDLADMADDLEKRGIYAQNTAAAE